MHDVSVSSSRHRSETGSGLNFNKSPNHKGMKLFLKYFIDTYTTKYIRNQSGLLFL